MYRNPRWFFTALSITTAGMLIAAPAAWAGDDKKSDDHNGRAATTQVKSRDRGDDHAAQAAPPAVKVEHENEAVEHQNAGAVEPQNEAVEHANVAANQANEAAEKAAERAAEAAREAAEEAAAPATAAAPTTVAAANLLGQLNNQAAELAALTAMTPAADVENDDERRPRCRAGPNVAGRRRA